MRIAFFGTPELAVPTLDALVVAGHEVSAVFTRPKQRRQRRGDPIDTPVASAANELGLNVIEVTTAQEIDAALAGENIEGGVVVAFGLILTPSVIALPKLGLLNLHFSLLPRWRGASPVQHAILAGDTETGVCVMQLEEGLDTGPVRAKTVCPVDSQSTAGSLFDSLSQIGARLMTEVLAAPEEFTPEPQSGAISWAPTLKVDDFRIDVQRPAKEIERMVRAGNPRPGAWVTISGNRVKIEKAHVSDNKVDLGIIDKHAHLGTANGTLVLDVVHPQGRKSMSGVAWLAGLRTDKVQVDT
jgi:methionyl-tRNA formyltransferase